MFYVAQFFGLMALIVLILSFWTNAKSKLLKYQIFSSILFALQYLCLKAYSGFFMNVLALVRNIIFRKSEKNIPFYYLVIIIILMCFLGMLSYDGVISLLPSMVVIITTISLWQKNLTIIRICEIIVCILLIIYNINVMAYVGLISAIAEMIFVLYAIYKYDIKK